MKRSPSRDKLFHGRTTTVETTLPDLLRYPRGSTCLYLTPDTFAFQASAHTMARRAGGSVHIEPLIALNLKTDEIIDITRITVNKSAKPPGQFKAATINFCAPPGTLARCQKGTAALYEKNRGGKHTNAIEKNFYNCGAKPKTTMYHVIDIRRGITYPICKVVVAKRGRPYRQTPKNYPIYQEFM